MRISLDRDDLAAALSAARGFVDRSPIIPILKCLRLSAEDDYLEILATDMVISGGLAIKADVAMVGSVAVDAESLHGFVSRIPAGSIIELVHEGTSLGITSGRIKGGIDTPAPASLYPAAKVEQYPVRFKLSRDDITKVISLPAPAISTNVHRPTITGLHLSVVDGRLAGTSTNGLILIRSFIDLPAIQGSLASADGVIIPSKAINNLKSISSNEIMIGLSENSAKFYADNIVIITRLIVGPYVDSDSVIFDDVESSIEMNRVELIKAIDRIMILTDADTKGVRVTCAEGVATLSSVLIGKKSAAQDMDATLQGQNFEFGVNGKQILTLLNVCSGERVKIGRGRNKRGHFILRVFDPNNADVTMIIVPERV